MVGPESGFLVWTQPTPLWFGRRDAGSTYPTFTPECASTAFRTGLPIARFASQDQKELNLLRNMNLIPNRILLNLARLNTGSPSVTAFTLKPPTARFSEPRFITGRGRFNERKRQLSAMTSCNLMGSQYRGHPRFFISAGS
jgi:hypothetical protein